MLRRHWSNAVILTLWYQYPINVVHWLNDAATLPQRCHKVVCLLTAAIRNKMHEGPMLIFNSLTSL